MDTPSLQIVLQHAAETIFEDLSGACCWSCGENIWWVKPVSEIICNQCFACGTQDHIVAAMKQLFLILHAAGRDDKPVQPLWVKYELEDTYNYIARVLETL